MPRYLPPQVLDVHNNSIGPEGGMAVAEVLRVNKVRKGLY